jgi:magnesium-transporting ATPase (P-type)
MRLVFVHPATIAGVGGFHASQQKRGGSGRDQRAIHGSFYQGASEAEARTIAVKVFAVGQSFYLLNCRSLRFSMFGLGLFSNPWIWSGIAAMTAVQLLFTCAPIMNDLFHTAPIGLVDWLHIQAVGLVIYMVIGFEKALR